EIFVWVNEFSDDPVNELLIEVLNGNFGREEIYLYGLYDSGFIKKNDIPDRLEDVHCLHATLKDRIVRRTHHDILPCYSFNVRGDKFRLDFFYTDRKHVFETPSQILKYLRCQIEIYDSPFRESDYSTWSSHWGDNALIFYGYESPYHIVESPHKSDFEITVKSCRVNPRLMMFPQIKPVVIERVIKQNIFESKIEERIK